MIVDYSEYLKKKALLSDPNKDISPDVRAKVEAALAEYDSKFGVEKDASMPLRPDEGAAAINGAKGLPSQEDISHTVSSGPANDLANMVDPGFATIPQALAVQPATTHPKGDKSAEDEWVRGDLSNPNGVVVVYDAPMAQVQKDLAENPALLDSLGMSISPGAQVQKGDSVEQAYQQFKWRQVADAAAKAGKTAYRYSKAPWLADGKNANILDSLSLKLKSSAVPAMDSASAFVLGVDDMGNFGAGRVLNETGAGDIQPLGNIGPYKTSDFTTPKPGDPYARPASKDETAGGIPAPKPGDTPAERRERNRELKDEHRGAYVAGQVGAAAPGLVEAAGKGVAKGVGMLSEGAGAKVAQAAEGIGALGEWLPSNQLWSYVTGQPAQTIAGKVVGGAVKNAAAGAISEGVQTAGEAASNYAATGDTGMNRQQVADRLKTAGAMSGVLGSLGGLLHAGSTGFGNWVREGDYYRQLPGTVEALGSEPRFLKGFSTPPAVEAAREEARVRPGRPKPIDMIAEKTDKPLGDAVYHEEARTIERVKQQNEEVFNSPEGRMPLPASDLAKSAVEDLRTNTSRQPGVKGPTSVGLPNAERPARAVLNTNVEGVSVHPVEGGIPMTPEEAQAWLHPKLQEKAVEAARSKKVAPVTETDLATVEKDYEPDLGGSSEELARTGDYYESPAPLQLEGGTGSAIEKAPKTEQPRGAPPTPELPASDTRFSPEGPDHRPGRAESPPEAPSAAPTGGGPMVRGSRPQGPREASARETGPRGEGSPKETRYSTQAPEQRGQRWKRTGEPEVIETKGEPKAGTTAQELRKAGVKTVYVLPRRYDARRQEAVIHLLRTGGGDSERARRLVKFYQAAKRDRLQRPWQGEAQGYSKLQAQHEQMLDTAKDLRKRVAPKGSAYSATKRHGKPSTDSRNIDAVQRAAQMAGGNQPELVNAARIMQPLSELQGLSTFGRTTSSGGKRLPYGLSAISDAMMLRGIYPATRAIERSATGGAQTASRLGQAALHDARDEDQQKKNAPQAKASQPKRKRYPRK